MKRAIKLQAGENGIRRQPISQAIIPARIRKQHAMSSLMHDRNQTELARTDNAQRGDDDNRKKWRGRPNHRSHRAGYEEPITRQSGQTAPVGNLTQVANFFSGNNI
jgi:hypothetical protein